MKKIFNRNFVVLLIVTLLLMPCVLSVAHATGSLGLETSYEWATDGHSYAEAVATGDIDNDGIIEIVTVGYFRNSTTSNYDGELDIWNWNGTQLTLEHAEHYYFDYTLSSETRFTSVALGDVDNDSSVEVVIAGYGYSLFIISIMPPKIVYQQQGILLVGSWNGTVFTRKAIYSRWPDNKDYETEFFGLAVGDVDKDNITEIVTVGYENMTGFYGVLTIWNVTDSNLVLETSFERLISGETIWRAVSINDVDGDGMPEIIIVGDFLDILTYRRSAFIRICTWDGSTLEWKTSCEWYTYSNTYAFAVATGDIDFDGTTEIVTGGYQQTAETINAQLRIWTWKQDVLTLKLSIEGGIVEPPEFTLGKAVAIADIDADGANEIIFGIDYSMIFWSSANIRVFSWREGTLVADDFKDWEGVSSVQGIATGDVDGDGKVEIITAGYTAGLMIVPESDLGIWSVSKVASSITVTLSSASIIIGNQVTINGAVTNETNGVPISNVEVTIEYSHDPQPVFTYLATVTTNEFGEYAYSWIPPATGQYTIRASWKGDYEHDGASVNTRLTVEKAPSLIALTLSSYSAKMGDTVSVNGTLYPAKDTSITMYYTMPNGTIVVKSVNSNNAGIFSDTFTASQVGTWTIKANWTGDDVYAGTESSPATLTVAKIQSALSITASPLTVNVGNNVTITGTLTPAQIATITLTYTMPNGTIITKAVATAGTFTDIIKLDQAGIWQVKASWSGNAQYESSASAPISVIAQAVDPITPMLAMGGFGLGLIALILAALGVYMLSRKKKSAPSVSSPLPPAPPAPP